MMSPFALLNLGKRSLQPQRTEVEVVGQNLTNESDPANARHGVVIENSLSISRPFDPQGSGAKAVAIQPIRSACVAQQINTENGTVWAYTSSTTLDEAQG